MTSKFISMIIMQIHYVSLLVVQMSTLLHTKTQVSEFLKNSRNQSTTLARNCSKSTDQTIMPEKAILKVTLNLYLFLLAHTVREEDTLFLNASFLEKKNKNIRWVSPSALTSIRLGLKCVSKRIHFLGPTNPKTQADILHSSLLFQKILYHQMVILPNSPLFVSYRILALRDVIPLTEKTFMSSDALI